MLSSRLNAFVMPTSQTSADRVAERRSLPTSSHLRAGREHDRRGADLQRRAWRAGEAVEVVDEARDEEERAAGEDPDERLASARTHRPTSAAPDAGGEPGEDADAPEASAWSRSCQRSALGAATSRAASGERSSAEIDERRRPAAQANGAAMLTRGKGKGRLFSTLCGKPEGDGRSVD